MGEAAFEAACEPSEAAAFEAACEPAEAAASDANRRTCASCSTVFSSRQQLFRHLRSEGACKVEALGANATAPDKFALVFGWSVRPDDSASARSALVAAVASRAGVDAQTLDDSVHSAICSDGAGGALAEVAACKLPRGAVDDERSFCAAVNDELDGSGVRLWSCRKVAHDFNPPKHVRAVRHEVLLPLFALFAAERIARDGTIDTEAGDDPLAGRKHWDASNLLGTFSSGGLTVTAGAVHSVLKRLKTLFKACIGTFLGHNLIAGAVPSGRVLRTIVKARHVELLRARGDEAFVRLHVSGDLSADEVRRLFGLLLAVLHGAVDVAYLRRAVADARADALVAVPPPVPRHACLVAECLMSKAVHAQTRGALPTRELEEFAARLRAEATRAELDARAMQAWLAHGPRAVARAPALPKPPARFWTCAACRMPRNHDADDVCRKCHAVRGSDRKVRGETIAERCAAEALAERAAAPPEYARCLAALRAVRRSGQWPGTSAGRREVIADEPRGGGSFTLGCMPPHLAQPEANARFPELLRAVFELEATLAPDRPPSSSVAVNCNARFRPHRDSGAGAGQGVSLIVGLGDYAGGELFVEGEPIDIRYAPARFNGWKQRHWTNAFEGERFSLVWFTPLGCEFGSGLALARSYDPAG